MQRLVKYADELVTSVGSRPGASQGEHQAAELIAANLEDLGLDTWIQEYQCARGVGWVRVLYYMVAAIAAALLYFMPSLTWLSLILVVVAGGLLLLDLLGMNPLFELFNRGVSQNVVGRYSPQGADPRRKVVIVAHYDSGRSMLQCAPLVAPFYTIVRRSIHVCVAALFIVVLLSLLPLPETVLPILSIVGLIMGIIVLIAAIIEVINLFLPYNQGANCNASGVAAMMGVAGTLVGARENVGAQATMRGHERSQTARGAARAERGDEYKNEGTRRGGKTRTGASASITGAAGSLFSKAKGLVGKSSPSSSDDEYYDDYANDELAYDDRGSRKGPQLRSGTPVSRGASQSVRSERARAYEQDTAFGETDLGAAVLGQEAQQAAQRAAQQGEEASVQPQEQSARAQAAQVLLEEERYAAGMTAARSGGVRPVANNPAIRTRPPLAEQEEMQRALLAEEEARKVEESGKTADGVPSWFANAKKAAHQEAGKTSSEAEPKVVRSRYADVPLEYTAEPQATQRPEQRPAQPRPEQPRPEQHAEAQARPEQRPAQQRPEQVAEPQARPEQRERPLAERNVAPAEAVAPVRQKSPIFEQLDEPAPVPAPTFMPDEAAAPSREVSEVPTRERRLESDYLPKKGSIPTRATDPTARASSEEIPKSKPIAELATTFNADFSGIDRLVSDPHPTVSPNHSQRLPQGASLPTRSEAANVEAEAPAQDRLRNLPKMQMNNSGSIPTQQAGLDRQPFFAAESEQAMRGKVSNTGSFAPLGATGIMKPVGEELLAYHDNEQDIYLDDADESTGTWAGKDSADSRDYSPNMMEIPKSRTKSFFGSLGDRLSGGRKNETHDSSPSTWLGVDESYDARSEGSNIGGWENFSEEDDDEWKGGAYGGDSYEENATALDTFSSLLIDREVWIVALGSHENKNAGIKKLLSEYERDLKSALIINLDGVGAGDLVYTTDEGTFRTRRTDQRLQGLIKSASRALGIDIAPTKFTGYNTDAAETLASGARAISIMGLDGRLPAGWRWGDDRLDILDEDNIEAVADIVVEVIKSV